RNEVRLYSEPLAAKPHIVVLTKLDLLPEDAELPAISAPDAAGVLAVSSAAGQGIESLTEFLWKFVADAREAEVAQRPPAHFADADDDSGLSGVEADPHWNEAGAADHEE